MISLIFCYTIQLSFNFLNTKYLFNSVVFCIYYNIIVMIPRFAQDNHPHSGAPLLKFNINSAARLGACAMIMSGHLQTFMYVSKLVARVITAEGCTHPKHHSLN